MIIDRKKFEQELKFRTSRSSGAGGQHVNTTETRVELLFDVYASKLLNEEEKERFARKWKNRVNEEGVFSICSSQHRSQASNKEHVVAKFFNMLQKGLQKEKKRIATVIPTVVKNAILIKKKKRSEVKANRGKRTRDFL